MILILGLIAFFGLLIGLIRLLPDFSRFVLVKTRKVRYPAEFIDFGTIAVTLFFTTIIAITGLLFFKFCMALVAYVLSDGLVSFFVLLRGVFSIATQDSQNPFVLSNLLSGWLLTPAIQFVSIYLIFKGVRKFMTEINKKYTPAMYNESDAFYFGFIATIVFILLDLILFSQSIPTFSQIAHLVFLGLSKIALGCFYLSVAHIQLLKFDRYKQAILRYVQMKPFVKTVAFSPWRIILTTFIIALLLHIPFYTGTQFMENNWIIGLNMIVACAIGYFLLRILLAKGFNYLGVVMLAEGPSDLALERVNPEKEKKFYYTLGIIALLFILLKPKLFLFFSTLLVISGTFLLILLFTIYFIGLIFSVFRAKFMRISLPEISSKPIVMYLYHSGRSCLRGVGLMVGAIFLVHSFLTFFPKSFDYQNESFVSAVFDEEDKLLLSEFHDGNPSIPIVYSEVPPFLIKCLEFQEDRNFFSQNDWLPGKSNWHGFSFSAFYRFSYGGGGSNLNQQLLKNMAFDQANDIQRKFAELLSSYQLSMQITPVEIITGYLNEVGFNGARGHSGLVNGSIHTFGRPPKALSELEMMYLVSTLKRSSRFRTSTGYIAYKEAAYRSDEIKETLLDKAQDWFDQGLLTKKELYMLRNQELRFSTEAIRNPCLTSTNEYLRKEITNQNRSKGIYASCLSFRNQEQIKKAVDDFDVKFGSKLNPDGFNLYSAAIVVDVSSGEIIGHYGGKGVTDLTSLGTGYQIGSILKPFVLLELLEQGRQFKNVQLYDGKMQGKYTPSNFNRLYSNKFVGINRILKESLNAPMVNIRQYGNPIEVFASVEEKFSDMGISSDPYLDLSDHSKYGEYEVNYPLGSRSMTLLDVAQMYQALFNGGDYIELIPFSSYTGFSGEKTTLRQRKKKGVSAKQC